MAQPLGTVILAMQRIPPVLGQSVVVIGQGPMGQLFCATLRNLGARQIIAVDKLGYRLETSLKMGATDVVNSSEVDPVETVKSLTDGKGADLVIEVVGHTEQVLNLCIDLGCVDSRILFFGVPMDVIQEIHWRKLFWNRQNVITSVGPDFATDFPLAMQWIAEGRLDVSPLITHRYPLSELQRAFDQYHARGDNGLKILLDFPSAQ
jgi:threonine dehydrogenase-like Zn-dependent dehydrogenase